MFVQNVIVRNIIIIGQRVAWYVVIFVNEHEKDCSQTAIYNMQYFKCQWRGSKMHILIQNLKILCLQCPMFNLRN